MANRKLLPPLKPPRESLCPQIDTKAHRSALTPHLSPFPTHFPPASFLLDRPSKQPPPPGPWPMSFSLSKTSFMDFPPDCPAPKSLSGRKLLFFVSQSRCITVQSLWDAHLWAPERPGSNRGSSLTSIHQGREASPSQDVLCPAGQVTSVKGRGSSGA